jgi:sterol desaturase/sphingolipid hydroxylase (fatty acid hydroxylase superfamily)
MIAASIITGWAAWSLSFYWMHRSWHWGMARKSKAAIVVGELKHHELGDSDPYDIAADPEGHFVNFPKFVAAVLILVLAWIWCVLFGPLAALVLLTALAICSLCDTLVHNLAHLPQRYTFWPVGWVRRLHRIHHTTWRHNYSFVTGIVWDVIFGTYKGK